MMRALYAFCLFLVNIPAAQSDVISDINALLMHQPVLRGTFEQARYISGFKTPLRSSGTYVVGVQEGILWNTQKPFAGTLALTRDKIINRQGSNVTFTLNSAQEPSVHLLHRLLFAVLSGDVTVLGQYFDVQGRFTEKKTAWVLEMTPTDPLLAKQYIRVMIKGGSYVHEVTLIEVDGDWTEITLSRPDPAAKTFNASERSLLN